VGQTRGWKHDGPEEKAFTGGDVWLGEHSFSHATLAELRSKDWDVTNVVYGYVTPDQLDAFEKDGTLPTSWSGDIWGGDILKFASPSEYHQYRAENDTIPTNGVHIRLSWTARWMKDSAFVQWVFGDTLTEIAGVYGGEENVMVAFGFDS